MSIGWRTISCLTAIALSLAPAIAAAQTSHPSTSSQPARPTLWIVGDSTVHNTGHGIVGWGDRIGPFFDATRLSIQNRAIAGRSTRTFQNEGRWDKILAACKPGDFVLIQLGHNDGGPINDAKTRGSIPGLGEQTQEIVNAVTGKNEIVHTYGWYMRKFITDASARGMTPIICSPVPHVPNATVAEGDVEPSKYVQWSKEIAQAQHALFIPLNQITMSRFVGMTPQEIKAKYFTTADNTHSCQAGAELNARSVVQGIQALKNCPLASYLGPEPTFSPATQQVAR